MTKEKAREALLEGKKIRKTWWDADVYIYFCKKDFCLKMKSDNFHRPYIDFNDEHKNGWEIFEEKKKVTLYRYTYRTKEGTCFQNFWTTKESKEHYHSKFYTLVKTEKKEIEIEI